MTLFPTNPCVYVRSGWDCGTWGLLKGQIKEWIIGGQDPKLKIRGKQMAPASVHVVEETSKFNFYDPSFLT